MKSLIKLLALSFITLSCERIEPYSFPKTINIVNKECLQSWDNLEIELNDFGKKVYRFDAKIWFSLKENTLSANSDKVSLILESNSQNRIKIPSKEISNNNYILLQLVGYGDKGLVGTSKNYVLKTDNGGCSKWSVAE
jgi:hypothetical protein